MADEDFLSGMGDDNAGAGGGEPSFDDTMQQIADELFSGSDGDADAGDSADDATDASEAEGAEADDISPDTDAEGDGEGDDEDQRDDDGDGAADDDQPLTAPARWSAEDKAAFDALPREAQELVLKRERDVETHLNQKSQELSEERRRLSGISDLIEQRREAWALNGMTPDQAMSQLLSLSDYAGRDPQGFIRWFAEQRGIDLDQAGASDDDTDPKYQALKAEVQSLKQSQQQQLASAEEQRAAAIRSAVEEFAASQDHPYFDDVQSDIAGILPAIRQQHPGKSPSEWLQIAYDKAVWANDGTRAKLIEAERKREAEASRKKSAEDAKRAKRASSTNVRGRPGATAEKPKSMEETMREAYDRAVGA